MGGRFVPQNGRCEMHLRPSAGANCRDMGITINADNVAVLTRGRIYSDTNVTGLWKSKEIELFAKAAYEWTYGSRRKAYGDMSKASFKVIIGEEVEDHLMRQRIGEYTDEEKWKNFVVEVFSLLPDVNMGVADWVNEFANMYCGVLEEYGFQFLPGRLEIPPERHAVSACGGMKAPG